MNEQEYIEYITRQVAEQEARQREINEQNQRFQQAREAEIKKQLEEQEARGREAYEQTQRMQQARAEQLKKEENKRIEEIKKQVAEQEARQKEINEQNQKFQQAREAEIKKQLEEQEARGREAYEQTQRMQQARTNQIIEQQKQQELETKKRLGVVYNAATNTTYVKTNIYMNYNKLIQNKNQLNAIAKEIQNTWNSVKSNELTNIQNSWAGKDSKAYIDKITALDTKVNAAINAINLLGKTFDQAANTLQDTQNRISSTLTNI